MTTAVELQSITLDDRGRPIIAGTRFKVKLLALEHIHWDLSAEQLHEAHPPLTLSQIYAALAYYYEHQPEMDAEMAADELEIERYRQVHQNAELQEKLRQRKESP